MGRNRNRVPQFVYISKQQYLDKKNIPHLNPVATSIAEIDPYHHATIITMNPFSKEKGLFIPDMRTFNQKKNNTSSLLTNKEQTTIQDFMKSQDSTKLNFFNSEENEILKEIQSSGEKNKADDLKNNATFLKKERNNEEIKIQDQQRNPNEVNYQGSKHQQRQNQSSNNNLPKKPNDPSPSNNKLSTYNKEVDIQINIHPENKSLKNLESDYHGIQNLNDPRSSSSFHQNKSPTSLHINVQNIPQSKNINLNLNNTDRNSPINNKNPIQSSKLTPNLKEDTHSPVFFNKSQDHLQFNQEKSPIQLKNALNQEQAFIGSGNQSQSHEKLPNQLKNTVNQEQAFTSINNQSQSPKILKTEQNPNHIYSSPVQDLQTSFHSQGNPSSNSPLNQNMDDGRLRKSKKIIELSQSFDQNQNLYPKSKSPSRFSPSPKMLREIEKASSVISDKIQKSPEYIKNFDEKHKKTYDSVFELKSQILDLKDALNLQIEKYEQLDGEFQYTKRNEEVLEARIMAYKETCDAFAEEINEIKGLQENLGNQISRLQEIEKINENIRDFEQETLAIFDENNNGKNDLRQKYEDLRKELEIKQGNEEKDKENQLKIIENIRLLEEEIAEFNKRRDSLGFLNEDEKEKENWSPRTRPPNSGRRENLVKSPWDKSRLLEMLESFFESKISSFNILLEKQV